MPRFYFPGVYLVLYNSLQHACKLGRANAAIYSLNEILMLIRAYSTDYRSSIQWACSSMYSLHLCIERENVREDKSYNFRRPGAQARGN